MYKFSLQDFVKERCKLCGEPATIKEKDTDFYCAKCIVKRDNIKGIKHGPNNDRF